MTNQLTFFLDFEKKYILLSDFKMIYNLFIIIIIGNQLPASNMIFILQKFN